MFVGIGEEALAEAGASKAEVLLLGGPLKMADHHLLPRQFEAFLAQLGIDIDEHTVSLSQLSHLKGIHGNGLGKMSGKWNKIWEGWIEDNKVTATAKDVYQQLGRMMDQFEISHLRIHPYRE